MYIYGLQEAYSKLNEVKVDNTFNMFPKTFALDARFYIPKKSGNSHQYM
jgi:hypothetical protein